MKQTRYWHTIPREDRYALIQELVNQGLLDEELAVTPLGELYIPSARDESSATITPTESSTQEQTL
jgi:hypothetical protein